MSKRAATFSSCLSPLQTGATESTCFVQLTCSLDYSNILIELPQPTAKNPPQRPERCSALAYAHGYFYNRNAEGRPRIMALRSGVSLRTHVLQIKDQEESEV